MDLSFGIWWPFSISNELGCKKVSLAVWHFLALFIEFGSNTLNVGINLALSNDFFRRYC